MRNKPILSLYALHRCSLAFGQVSRWAPSSENNTEAYIRHVCEMSGLSPFQELHFEDHDSMVRLVDAMIRVECGKPVAQLDIEKGYAMV